MPSVSLPKGGGAIKGLGEKFTTNAATGTGTLAVTIPTSPGRSGFGPQLTLSYDSGSGNGPFGFGWSLSTASINRKTEKGLPRYDDAVDSDVFILSGAEDLVPVYRQDPDGTWIAAHPGYQRDADGFWVRDPSGRLVFQEDDRDGYRVRRYCPRIEGLFARIERWSRIGSPGDVHWRSISKDNVLTVYGHDATARVADPLDPTRIFSWLICETRDDKGNAVLFRYKPEDGIGVDFANAHERNRGPRDDARRTGNRYLKRILYGNRVPLLDSAGQRPRFLDPVQIDAQVANAGWMFEVVFDYGDHDPNVPAPNDDQARDAGGARRYPWKRRPDPFSSYRSGFEVRTTRLCRRVLMFHHFPDEPGVGRDCLVRSTEFTYSDEVDPTDVRAPVYTLLRAVTQRGYRRTNGAYDARGVPPVEFEYTEPRVQDAIEEVDPESLENLPAGLDGTIYRWIDLHGEGIPGILSEQGGAWFYKRNHSPIPIKLPDGRERVRATFAPLEAVRVNPNVALSRGAEFMDLAGDGQPDVVLLDGPTPGLYEHDDADGWESFRPFTSRLNRDIREPNLRIVDLDGDGHGDVLITEDDAFVWHRSLAEQGFGPAERVAHALDEEKGPRVVFADRSQSIYLADLSGDGLTDIVRIRNGEVCYWPNVGYGRFGAKVTMDNAPSFDRPDQFDPARVRLSDIDGSGTTDIIYVHQDGVRLYFNQSGNSWSKPHRLNVFPRVDEVVSIMPADLLGNGTACLVWSSPLAHDRYRSMRYVNLMGERKPHLLVKTVNNLGAETRIDYAPSTRFYLEDKRAGKPWISRLPFPVHVVTHVETHDHVSRNRFVTRYAYHHGWYDGEEREFRGFGMVEQWDTEELGAFEPSGVLTPAENTSDVSHAAPIHTRTWFHTGMYLRREHISDYFAGVLDATDAGEYFREPGLRDADARALLLPDTTLPAGLSMEEEREACRALKGLVLHQEMYADDAGPAATPEEIRRAGMPYTVTEQNFSVRRVQPRGANRHAVFFTHPRETITYHYEREPSDPRIQHTLILELDDFGSVLKQASIGYGRRAQIRVIDPLGQVQHVQNPGLPALPDDRVKQTTTLLTYTESRVTNIVESADARRNPLPAESVTFELTGYAATGPAGRYQPADLVEPDPGAPLGAQLLRHKFIDQVAYEATATANPCRRPIEWVRTLYRGDDLTALLPLGQLQSLALPGEAYKLAFTPGLLTQVFQRPRSGQAAESLIPDPDAVLGGQGGNGGGYLRSQTLKADGRFPPNDPDDHWWAPSGRSFFGPTAAADAASELTLARQHFFLPRRHRDPFGQDAVTDFDANDLLIAQTRDALGNAVTVHAGDYRVLEPRLVSDANGNRTEVAFDILGMVVGMAVMGKPQPAPVEGDTLTGFVADLTQGEIDGLFDAADPRVTAPALLQGATTRFVYDLHRFRRTQQAAPNASSQWRPPSTAILMRETHVNAPLPPHGLKIELGFSYSDGFGREIQKKRQAEAGPVTEGGPTVTPRWVGSGWTIFNNKGQPVRQYEPFFSATHRFEFGVAVGVSPVFFYDPVGRLIATLHPDHTYEKVVFDAWQQSTFDASDTCAARNTETGDPRTDADIGGYVARFFARLPASPPAPPWQTWHAQRISGALGPQAQAAATRAAAHADTPITVYLDALGRTFLTVARNRVECAGHDLDGTEEPVATRVDLDVEGNQRTVRDAVQQAGDPLGRLVMRYAYDMLGHGIHRLSIEAGAHWMLEDAVGKPLRAWDSRGHNFVTTYDTLRRPVSRTVRGTIANGDAASDPRTLNRDVVVERIEYGEPPANATQADENRVRAFNLRTRIYRHFDSAGVVTNARLDAAGNPVEAFDFKGNLLHITRRFASDYKTIPDWLFNPPLEDEFFETSTRYDALNRAVQSILPHSSLAGGRRHVIQPTFNDGNLLERVDVWLERPADPGGFIDPASEASSPVGVDNIDYDAKGQRLRVAYMNGATTRYRYDPETFRLVHLYTRRGAAFTEDCENPQPPPLTIAAPDDPPVGGACGLQNLRYTYDPVGNVTHVEDDAQQTIYFRNQRIEPSSDYTYDALYRLIQASGREHLGQRGNGDRNAPTAPDAFNGFHTRRDHPNVLSAMGAYVERYVYDAVGNILRMQHRGTDPVHAGWTRGYTYAENSLIEDGTGGALLKTSNRLTRSTLNPNGASPPQTDAYVHDRQGNIIRMPHLGGGLPGPNLHWDYNNQLRRVDLGGGGAAFYVYDATRRRMRKVWEKAPGLIEERIYLGNFEVFRRHGAPIGTNTATLERETLHSMDDQQRIALVELRTVDLAGSDPTPVRVIRYQLTNHLGSACLELDDQTQIISYEEYAPYGSSTYQAVRSQTETPKRYRYAAKERDEESGFFYYGARYYAPWLGRWASADPAGLRDGSNLYMYVRASPVRRVDPTGTQSTTVGDVADDAIKKLDDLDQPFQQQGAVGLREQALSMDIDEPNPVGQKGISAAEARARAVDPSNRQLLDPLTNRQTKHLGIDPRAAAPKPQTPISVAQDATALLNRRFSEITEMQEIFDEALAKIKDPGKLSPTELKNRINSNVWDVIKNGKSESASKVRAALDKLGLQNVPGRGYVMRTAEVPPQAEAAAKVKAAGRPYQFVKWGGRILLVVGVGMDVLEVYQAENKPKTITKKVGFWAGAWAGAKVGASGGAKVGAAVAVGAGQAGPQVAAPEEIVTVPAGVLIGGIIGGIGGGLIGGWAGGEITETVYEWTFERQ